MELTPEMQKRLLMMQQGEITGHYIYRRIAGFLPPSRNREVILSMATDELGHYDTWNQYARRDISPSSF
jgi:demethoxyubiquinone hydroxylase (CLK1/Coq7/Cat5 family)